MPQRPFPRCSLVASGQVLEKVCEYLHYNEKYKNSREIPDMDIPPELCLELLMAADYLDGRTSMPGPTVSKVLKL